MVKCTKCSSDNIDGVSGYKVANKYTGVEEGWVCTLKCIDCGNIFLAISGVGAKDIANKLSKYGAKVVDDGQVGS